MRALRAPHAAIILIAIILVCAALISASVVFAPLALALFAIALMWPLQSRLESILPKLIALLICMCVILFGFVLFGWLIVWAFSRVARAAVADVARFQAVYEQIADWFNQHGAVVGSIWSEHFNVGWLLRAVQNVGVRLNSITSFSIVALVYILLGLLEVTAFKAKIEKLEKRKTADVLLEGSRITSQKIRRYMLVRTQMSVVTGGLVFIFAYLTGLPLAKEWGVLAFVLNYVPFIGPLIATFFPTLFAAIEFQTWQATLGVFAALNLIQFVVGSYIEPRFSGSALSISPALVLFSIFFWTYMWGLFGAFIGVPITLALLTFCSLHDRTRWIAALLGGDEAL